MRLIDADALSARMYELAFETDSDMQRWDSGCWIRYKMFERAIADAPTIEPERKKGKWIDNCSCSICHWIHDDDKGFALLTNYHFCPNCGADMRGESDATD